MSTLRTNVYDLIDNERDRQLELWGDQNNLSLPLWMTVLTEEVGEAAKEVLDLEESTGDLIEELVQVAAVSISMIEHIIEGNYR